MARRYPFALQCRGLLHLAGAPDEPWIIFQHVLGKLARRRSLEATVCDNSVDAALDFS